MGPDGGPGGSHTQLARPALRATRHRFRPRVDTEWGGMEEWAREVRAYGGVRGDAGLGQGLRPGRRCVEVVPEKMGGAMEGV